MSNYVQVEGVTDVGSLKGSRFDKSSGAFIFQRTQQSGILSEHSRRISDLEHKVNELQNLVLKLLETD
jgi:hypothetical protein